MHGLRLWKNSVYSFDTFDAFAGLVVIGVWGLLLGFSFDWGWFSGFR